jgi:ribosome-associated protein
MLRQDLLNRLIQAEHLNEQLIDALEEAKKITNFEGKRRQLQFVGKLMRKLSDEDIDALKACLEEQQSGSSKETHMLHLIEAWRDRLMTQDEALEELLHAHPSLDLQQLRALIRQARRDNKTQPSDLSKGLAPRQSKAYRELFQFLKDLLLNPDQVPGEDGFDNAQESHT